MTLVELDHGQPHFSDDQRFVRAADVLWRIIPGVAVVLLCRSDDDVVILSGTGLALWQELAAPRRLEEVTLRFAEQYRAAPDVVASALIDVLKELHERGVVDRYDA